MPFGQSPKSDHRWRMLCLLIIGCTIFLAVVLGIVEFNNRLEEWQSAVAYNTLGVMLGTASVLLVFGGRRRRNEEASY